MTREQMLVVDGNEATADVAYRMNEVIAIYPITPASPMGELSDQWAAEGRLNLWRVVPRIIEMQSEAGAAGTVHGALQAGALTTTFTASQGLLLMIPNLYKIAGELTAFCMHVAARTVATHALSIFGDHSDVMACRGTGFMMLCSTSVQEAHDFACIGQAAALQSRVPVMHFFDGFRTSHEIARISRLDDEFLRNMIDPQCVCDHRARGLSPDHPAVRGTAQNPDAFFQAREACNLFYDQAADIVARTMDRFAAKTGRRYRLFEYVGSPDAERVVVLMGSGCQTAHETVEHLTSKGEKVGVLKVCLYRPFSVRDFVAAMPSTVRQIAVLDRTKEPGAIGEPLYLDVVAAIREAADAGRIDASTPRRIIGGRYGLSSKEFTPAMVKAVFDELTRDEPRNHFTVGIRDDVTHRSLEYDEQFDIERDEVKRAVFYGLGSDGTVGANKSSIKVIGEQTDQAVQGHFVYDSKKAGARTISHLRFGPGPIRSAYLIRQAHFVACHQRQLLERYDILQVAAPGAVFLLNTPVEAEHVWNDLPAEAQRQIIDKQLRLYVIDAHRVAQQAGLAGRINTVMQVCFFALSGVMPVEQATDAIKAMIEKSYRRKGDEIVRRNLSAVDEALNHLSAVEVTGRTVGERRRPPIVAVEAPDFVQRVTAVMLADQGDALPVSAFPPDGTWPLGTARWEKRNIAAEIPIWEPQVCIQCNQCALVCPHAAIRAAAYEPAWLDGAPGTFKATDYRAKDMRGLKYTIQVAPEDCTGCHLCVAICPAKDKANPSRKAINMSPHDDHVEPERDNYRHFLSIPPVDRSRLTRLDAKGSQFLLPLFEYSGACAGCGETPYIKLLTQLFGDRLMIANATGCSSIYGGNLPTTPYCADAEGRGPAWSNSLFEDNAEFGLGMRLAIDQHATRARQLLQELGEGFRDDALQPLFHADGHGSIDVRPYRAAVAELRRRLASMDSPAAKQLIELADHLVPRSVWIVGGDGWAYDIGYGGLDHVLAAGHHVKVLVLDTEVYSNTGGQQSKATPLGAAAKFAAAGKEIHKKDLGLTAMSYGHVYVASIAFGANMNQTVQALLEAEAYPGPSLVIAYSHCIAHGYDLRYGADQQKRAVTSGVWPLYRFDPRRVLHDDPPLQIDSGPITGSVQEYMANEARFRMVEAMDPQRFRRLAKAAQRYTTQRLEVYRQLAQMHVPLRPAASKAAHTPAASGGHE